MELWLIILLSVIGVIILMSLISWLFKTNAFIIFELIGELIGAILEAMF